MELNMDAKTGGKYALRTKSIIKRIESEKNRTKARCREPKEKQRPPPLSKYRRKTANARERNRMKDINDAFIMLQRAIPDLFGADAEKLTKITVLRLAVNYINALTGVLNDDCSFGAMDIEDVRELWCLENAHIAKPEHCAGHVIRTNKEQVSNANKNSKCSVNIKASNKVIKQTKCPSTLVTKAKYMKNKNTVGGKLVTTTKRPSKSKSKRKVCKTASIATSNGAYITLKNVALQTPPDRLGRHADNKPLMMSMTVKRPRMESCYLGPREANLPRLEPNSLPLSTTPQPHQPLLALTPCGPPSVPSHSILEPLIGATPFTPRQIQTTPCTSLPQSTPTDVLHTTSILQDLDIPLVRTDELLEFPRSIGHFRDSSCCDSAFLSEGLAPPSPLSGATSTIPTSVPVGDSSPVFSMASSDFSVCGSVSDCDSVLTTAVELESLLGDEPFKEEIEHLASAFAEEDDTLNLFLGHSTANFIYTDTDGC